MVIEGRARERPAPHPQLRPHHRPRARGDHQLPPLPPRRGDRARHARRPPISRRRAARCPSDDRQALAETDRQARSAAGGQPTWQSTRRWRGPPRQEGRATARCTSCSRRASAPRDGRRRDRRRTPRRAEPTGASLTPRALHARHWSQGRRARPRTKVGDAAPAAAVGPGDDRALPRPIDQQPALESECAAAKRNDLVWTKPETGPSPRSAALASPRSGV